MQRCLGQVGGRVAKRAARAGGQAGHDLREEERGAGDEQRTEREERAEVHAEEEHREHRGEEDRDARREALEHIVRVAHHYRHQQAAHTLQRHARPHRPVVAEQEAELLHRRAVVHVHHHQANHCAVEAQLYIPQPDALVGACKRQ